MNADTQALIIMAVVGIVAGWLASLLLGGDDSLVRYLIIGVIGSFVGGFLLRSLGVNLGIQNPLASSIVTATIGAVVVILLARLLV